MKARIKATGKIIEVEPVICGYNERGVAFYAPSDLNFDLSEPEEEVKKIHGWVAIDEAYDSCFLHTSKPHQESQGIADTGDYNTIWESDGETYLLDNSLFPDMDSDSDPVECVLTITIKPKKK